MNEFVTHKEFGEMRERLARIEEHTRHIPTLIERVDAVEKWKLRLIAVSSFVAGVVTYFAAEIKRALLNT